MTLILTSEWSRPLNQQNYSESQIQTLKLRSKRIDVLSRYLFPLVFAVFNVAYWTNYLIEVIGTIKLMTTVNLFHSRQRESSRRSAKLEKNK